MTTYAVNFRATSGYVTDGAGEDYNLGEVYPVNRQGFNQGWVGSAYGDTARNRSNTNDRRLAGMNQVPNAASQYTFRIQVASAGQYSLRMALGDASNAQSYQYIQVLDSDNSTVLATIDDTNGTTASNSFDDATGTQLTAANWVTSNTAVTITLSGTSCYFRVGSPGVQTENTCVAHLSLTSLTNPPTAGFSTSIDRKTVTVTSTASAGSNPITSTTYDYDHGGAGSSPGDTLTTHTYTVGGTYTIRQTVSDGTLSDTEDASVTTKTRYTYTVITVPGGRRASTTADRPDA